MLSVYFTRCLLGGVSHPKRESVNRNYDCQERYSAFSRTIEL